MLKDKTEQRPAGLAYKINAVIRENKEYIVLAGIGIIAFILANSVIFGVCAPFAVALTATLKDKQSYAGAIGAVVGYVASSMRLGNLKYIAALIVVLVAGHFYSSRPAKLNSVIFPVLSVFCGMLISCIAIIVAANPSIYEILINFSEIFLASGSTYFFGRTISALSKSGLKAPYKSDISCIIISLALILSGISSFKIAGFSLGRTIAVLLILIAAKYGGEAAGCIIGSAAGFAIGISGRDFTFTISAFTLGGLLAGVFSYHSKVAAIGAFLAVNTIMSVLTNQVLDVYTITAEILLASAIFVIIPQNYTSRVINGAGLNAERAESPQRIIKDKIVNISKTLREVGSTAHKVSEKLEKMDKDVVLNLETEIVNNLCGKCGFKLKCLTSSREEFAAAMTEVQETLKKKGILTQDNLPKYFLKHCCKTNNLLSEANILFGNYISKKGVERKVSRVRSVVTEQFEGIALMLDEISADLCSIKTLDIRKTAKIESYFKEQKFLTENVICYTDEFMRICIEAHIPSYHIARVNKGKMALDLCALLDVEFDLPVICEKDYGAVVTFFEKANFTIDIGAYQIMSRGERLCGDSYDYSRNQWGKAHIVLSDGMGSGGEAAIDSSMAVNLINKLLSAGVEEDAALKLVNSALLVKSGEESLATVDICTFDLFLGKASFFKAGAAASFLLRDNKVASIESSSLPAGILSGISFERSYLNLRAGDVIVMVSDGIVLGGSDWVSSELRSIEDRHAQKICEKLANTAKKRHTDGFDDDITVITAVIDKVV